MTCTVCGYAMSAFDSGCPRCAQSKAEAPTQPAPQGNWTQPASTPTQVAPQAPPQGGWTQPGQPPQAPPYQVPPQGQPYQQPQQPGYPPAYPQPLPAKKGINPVVIVVLVFFALCSLPIIISVLTMVGGRVNNTFENAPQTTPTQRTTSSTVTPQVRMGPSFGEVDSKMSSRQYEWTEAQQQAYWATVQGTQISWSGEITEVKMENGGSIMLKCNPKTFTFDVSVSLDGSQLDKLAALSKGQRITIVGILNSHSTFGYTIKQGRVTGL